MFFLCVCWSLVRLNKINTALIRHCCPLESHWSIKNTFSMLTIILFRISAFLHTIHFNSPFGLRCNGIHDPRMNSTASSWLPHSDTPVNNLKTDLNVDTSYHINLAALHQSNPFAHDLIWDHRPSLVVGYKERKKEVKAKNDGISTPSTVIDCMRADSDNNDDWADTYALVCNMANFKGESRSTKDRRFSKKSFGFVNSNRMVISELQKLSIAVIMSYNKKTEEGGERLLSSPHREYIYKPMALVYNELCMIVSFRSRLRKGEDRYSIHLLVLHSLPHFCDFV